MEKQNQYFNPGKDKKVALIFSAPGKFEDDNKRPVAGKTGENLKALLIKLQENNLFKEYKCIYDFTITNSVTTVEFINKTQRTQATNKEICINENLKRLANELNEISDYIICFGEKAKYAVKQIKSCLNENVKIINTRHLSPRAFNRINGKNTYEERLNFYYESIINQM